MSLSLAVLINNIWTYNRHIKIKKCFCRLDIELFTPILFAKGISIHHCCYSPFHTLCYRPAGCQQLGVTTTVRKWSHEAVVTLCGCLENAKWDKLCEKTLAAWPSVSQTTFIYALRTPSPAGQSSAFQTINHGLQAAWRYFWTIRRELGIWRKWGIYRETQRGEEMKAKTPSRKLQNKLQ